MESIDQFAKCLIDANFVAVLTGAGVSAESGVATFRDGLQGLWRQYDPMQLATPEGFAKAPELVSRWYSERMRNVAGCVPNPGHQVLAALEQWYQEQQKQWVLLTQNVDRLHHKAGSRNVVELHGTFWIWRCTTCSTEFEQNKVHDDTRYPIYCQCGGILRPGVVWFGEQLPWEALQQAEYALKHCDVFLSLGTSAQVEPAAGFVHVARRHGATILEINLDSTPISDRVDLSLRGKTGELLPMVLAAFKKLDDQQGKRS